MHVECIGLARIKSMGSASWLFLHHGSRDLRPCLLPASATRTGSAPAGGLPGVQAPRGGGPGCLLCQQAGCPGGARGCGDGGAVSTPNHAAESLMGRKWCQCQPDVRMALRQPSAPLSCPSFPPFPPYSACHASSLCRTSSASHASSLCRTSSASHVPCLCQTSRAHDASCRVCRLHHTSVARAPCCAGACSRGALKQVWGHGLQVCSSVL